LKDFWEYYSGRLASSTISPAGELDDQAGWRARRSGRLASSTIRPVAAVNRTAPSIGLRRQSDCAVNRTAPSIGWRAVDPGAPPAMEGSSSSSSSSSSSQKLRLDNVPAICHYAEMLIRCLAVLAWVERGDSADILGSISSPLWLCRTGELWRNGDHESMNSRQR